MFERAWTWVLPVIAAGATMTIVLVSTPPGFAALSDVVFGTPRGTAADAAAYALGAAASLGLLALIVMALLCAGLERTLHRQR